MPNSNFSMSMFDPRHGDVPDPYPANVKRALDQQLKEQEAKRALAEEQEVTRDQQVRKAYLKKVEKVG